MLLNSESLHLVQNWRIVISMEPVYPGISKRFPRLRERIMELCVSDIAVCELCEDYDEVLKVLSAFTGETHVENKSIDELKLLKHVLEQELQERLDRNRGVDHQKIKTY